MTYFQDSHVGVLVACECSGRVRLHAIEGNVDWLTARGCIDEEMKADIVRAIWKSNLWTTEAAAKKIVNILEALNSDK